MSDAPVLLVLHALRLRSFATAEVVAERFGMDLDATQATLALSAESGWATFRDGRMTGWSLTTDGRAEGERLLADELARAGSGPAVEDDYRLFLELNGELLAICTDWQVVERDGGQTVNDHTDPDHDESVLERLDLLHTAALPISEDLARALDRFGGYTERLVLARERVRSGDVDWLTKPVIDSYHTIWFELHEDLLATLGRQRSQERP